MEEETAVAELLGVRVEIMLSELDGRVVVQIDTTDDLGEDEAGEPALRIYLNDWRASGRFTQAYLDSED